MKVRERVETGELISQFGWLFLRTSAGHHWRLIVDEDRVRFLVGMQVRVTGTQSQGTITVEGITPA